MRASLDDTRELVIALFEAVAVPSADAVLVADSLVGAEARGTRSHGLLRVTHYINGILDEAINPSPDVRTADGRGAVRTLDGDNGLGVVVVQRAVDTAVDLAREHGVGVVAVRNSNHSGVLAIPALRGADDGFVTQVISSAPPLMAPWGARDALISNAPMALAVPTSREPVVLDLACSVAARGRIRHAAIRGQEIPLGWALNEAGQPTVDASAAMRGVVLPFGEHKGSGLAFMHEALSWGLSGAVPCYQVPVAFLQEGTTSLDSWGIGHLISVMDPRAFDASGAFPERVTAFVDTVRGARPAEGFDAVRVPGEIEQASWERARGEGLDIDSDTAAELQAWTRRLGINAKLRQVLDA